jgi:hypothetical protein
MEHQLDATITVLLIFKISSTCFGQTFAHLQKRKTEIFFFRACCLATRSENLPTTSTGHYTICCKKKSQFCASEDGQKLARNMLSWSWRTIKLLLLDLVGVPYLPYLHWWCTVKHKSSLLRNKVGSRVRRQDEQPISVRVLEGLDLPVKGCKRKST